MTGLSDLHCDIRAFTCFRDYRLISEPAERLEHRIAQFGGVCFFILLSVPTKACGYWTEPLACEAMKAAWLGSPS
ncbi:MAG: hypothetical protein WB676_19520 [Bryobacteraceae bacterium]